MADLKGKTFLVTGGAGFIGSNMCETLVEKGATVVAYDNLSSGRYQFIKGLEAKDNFKFIKADVLNPVAITAAIKTEKVDVVIHLAANADVRKGFAETDLDLKQGVLATYNVLEAMRKTGVKDILFSSSSAVYGNAEERPTPESYGPLLPVSFYGSSKLASEGLITAFSNLYGFRYYIYRFANIAGKNGTHGVIPDFIKKLKQTPERLDVLGDGQQKKSYVGVTECIDAILHVYHKSTSAANLYNIASDDQISVKEIAELVRDSVSPSAKISFTKSREGWPGDIADSYLENAKLKELGFSPKLTSKETVRDAIAEVTTYLSK